MPEIKTISTQTELYKYTNKLEIFTFYVDPNCPVRAFISDVVDVVNAVSYIENELIIIDNDTLVDFFINDNGELIATGQDVDKYKLYDQSGNLQIDV